MSLTNGAISRFVHRSVTLVIFLFHQRFGRHKHAARTQATVLVADLARLPGIGRKSLTRLADQLPWHLVHAVQRIGCKINSKPNRK